MTDIELQEALLKEIEPLFKEIENSTTFECEPLITKNKYSNYENKTELEWVCPKCGNTNADNIHYRVTAGYFYNDDRRCKKCGKVYTKLETDPSYKRLFGCKNILFYKTKAGTDTGVAFISSQREFKYNSKGMPEGSDWKHQIENFGCISPNEKILFVHDKWINGKWTYRKSNSKLATVAQRFSYNKKVLITKDCPLCGLNRAVLSRYTPLNIFQEFDEMLESNKKKRTAAPKCKTVRHLVPEIKDVTDFCVTIEEENADNTATANIWCTSCDNVFSKTVKMHYLNWLTKYINIRCPQCGKEGETPVPISSVLFNSAEIQDNGDSINIIPSQTEITDSWNIKKVNYCDMTMFSVDKKTGKIDKYLKSDKNGNYIKTQKAPVTTQNNKLRIDPQCDIFELSDKEGLTTLGIAKYISYAVQNRDIIKLCKDRDFLNALVAANTVNLNAVKKEDILSVSKEIFELSKTAPENVFKMLDIFPDMTPDNYHFMTNNKITDACCSFKKAVNNISCSEMCEYIKTVEKNEYIAINGIICLWTDYIKTARRLNWNTEDENILFPDVLQSAYNKARFSLTGHKFNPSV